MPSLRRTLCAALAAVAATPDDLVAQTTAIPLPPVVVESDRSQPSRDPSAAPRAVPSAAAAGTAQPAAAAGGSAPSLTVPTADQARAAIQRWPGAVTVVPDTVFRNAPAQTLKDIVDYVPGVWAQPKWGDDSRLSIRGSGLSRNFHLRSTQLYMDGIPINTSDGYGDFQEIDPTAYRYVEVFRGANALRFGANSLGGAINFVSPTGRDASILDSRFDAGAFGFLRGQVSSGAAAGPFDYFVTTSKSQVDGYREHSWGEAERTSANIGYQLSPLVETRFFLNANTVRQRIPGEVTKDSALLMPAKGWADNIQNDWQRNIDTLRIANKTTIRLGETTIDFGLFGVDRHLMHPIFQWLDYRYKDHGGFVRAVDDRAIGGFRNRLTLGLNVVNGTIEANQYANIGGIKGTQLSALVQKPENYSFYGENAWYLLPNVSLIGGAQYLRAVRDLEVRFSMNGDVPGRSAYNLWSPKGGILWDVDANAQVFANVSRSAEAPSFGESVSPNFLDPTLPTIRFFDIKPQTATTYEVGTRGVRPDLTWDLALYRAEIRNELQCLYSSFGNCNVTNADRTIHQGIEAAFGISLLKGLAVHAGDPDRVWLNVAYTRNDFRYDGDPVFGNNLLPGAPPHYLRAELLYKHPAGFSFGPNIEWVPQDYFVDSANTLTADGYVLWGLKAAYDDGKNFSAYIEGRNLSDVAYISSASIIDRATGNSRLFSPGNGRGVYGGIRFKL